MKITKPLKAFYEHDIHKQNVDKVGYLVPMICNADIVFHFSTETWFSKTVDQLGFQKIDDRLHKYTLWLNFDELDKVRQRYIHNKKLGVVSVTRWSSLKNIRRSIDIMDVIQQKTKNWDCAVYGIERSIGAKFDIIDYDKTIYVNTNGSKENEKNGSVYVYGPVVQSDGVNIVGSHLFATSFFSLPNKPENYGDRQEYSQIEIIAVGTIPVFDKHWAKNNKLNDGRIYYDIPYSAVYTDGNNIEDTVNELIEISKDENLLKKFFEM
jgi:hypothetical protein